MEGKANGAFRVGANVQTAINYTVGPSDVCIDVVTTGGAVTVTLPAVTQSVGRLLAIKKISALNSLTISGTIEGAGSLILYNTNASVMLFNDGTNWRIYGDVQDFGGANPLTYFFPVWLKFTVTHTQLQAAALTNNIEVFSLPIAGVIHATKIKHSVIFTGTGITDYKVSLGLAADLTKYGSLFDVDTAVTSTNFQMTQVLDSQDNGGVTSVKIAAQSAGANLNQSTGGTVEIGLLVSRVALP
jgi:hypothetical protein